MLCSDVFHLHEDQNTVQFGNNRMALIISLFMTVEIGSNGTEKSVKEEQILSGQQGLCLEFLESVCKNIEFSQQQMNECNTRSERIELG